MMEWNNITDTNQIDLLIKSSFDKPQVIFKHSTRCSISSMALNRFERLWNYDEKTVIPHFLDLIEYRQLSNAIAIQFNIMHESPQLLLIKNGVCIYNASHNGISVATISGYLNK